LGKGPDRGLEDANMVDGTEGTTMSEQGKKLKFETYRYADISTGYVTEKDSEILTACGVRGDPVTGMGGYRGPGPIVYDYLEGFFVWVPQGNPEALPEYLKGCKEAGLSDQFCRLVSEVLEQGCTFLNLDRDGGEVDGLEKFDW